MQDGAQSSTYTSMLQIERPYFSSKTYTVVTIIAYKFILQNSLVSFNTRIILLFHRCFFFCNGMYLQPLQLVTEHRQFNYKIQALRGKL